MRCKKNISVALAALFTIHSSLFTLSSCTAPIDVNVRPGEARIVINSILTDVLSVQRVTVQRTVPYFSNETANWIDDATVSITTSGGRTYRAWWYDPDKAYLTEDSFATAPGETYTLDVEYDFDEDGTPEHYTATTSILEQPQVLEKIEIVPFTMPMITTPMYELQLFGQDPPGRNFYVMRLAVNGVMYEKLENFMTVGDRMFQNGKIDGFPLSIFPGAPSEENPDRTFFSPGSNVTVYLSNVDADLMRYIAEVQSSGSPENPLFGGPPHNVRTNFSGGALGFFGSLYSTSQYETIVPGEPEK